MNKKNKNNNNNNNIYAHNKNKPYTTPRHIRTITSRLLSECGPYIPNYNDDADMKSVKENFDRQTSKRFEEYKEHVSEKRQKYKEQCDKDIQKIILKDKMEKSLAENLEKYCLRCGCGLGGVAAGVGLFGALGTYGWKVAATATAKDFATQEGTKAGIQAVITAIKDQSAFIELKSVPLTNFIDGSNYKTVEGLVEAIKVAMESIQKPCTPSASARACNAISANSVDWLGPFAEAGKNAATDATAAAEKAELFKVTTTSSNAYSAIGYSVTAILIIVFVMVIIYLILRYRRKKKMNKKGQYTKLLNQ
ncbi:PIR protein, putative [Plasmodium sp. gorilla clade G1]|nr:PIR protein, putative [Plasmodium sp. gorilla clade G1]